MKYFHSEVDIPLSNAHRRLNSECLRRENKKKKKASNCMERIWFQSYLGQHSRPKKVRKKGEQQCSTEAYDKCTLKWSNFELDCTELHLTHDPLLIT